MAAYTTSRRVVRVVQKVLGRLRYLSRQDNTPGEPE